MSRLLEADECERCGDRIDALRRLCPGVYVRGSERAGGSAMRSRAPELESPKASGDALDGEIVHTVDELESVSDHTATWHDARTTAVLERENLTLEQRCETSETLSTRAMTLEVESTITIDTD